jgi:CubicO group peptidase (beta-lactamase class C family)
MKKVCCLFVLLLSFFSCTQDKTKVAEPEVCYFAASDASLDSIRNNLKRKQRYIEEYYSSLYKSGAFNGCVLVAEEGKIVYMGAFGYSDIKRKTKLEVETPFQLASVSKVITSVAVMQLYERGLLNLDDKVSKFIPEFPYNDILIEHLLSHRSGLPRYEAFNQKQWNWNQPMTNEDMIALYARYKPNVFFKAGKNHDYSNANFGVLAAIVSRISKKSFQQYCKENIFEPAGMKHSFVLDINNPPSKDSIALGHAKAYRFPLEPQQDYLNGVVGDKGIYATVVDLYKFDFAMSKEKLLKAETQQLIYSRTIKSRKAKFDDYGLGHRLKDWHMNGQFIPYHSGWWRGFKSLFIRDIFDKKTIIVLSNQEISPQAQLIWGTLDLI